MVFIRIVDSFYGVHCYKFLTIFTVQSTGNSVASTLYRKLMFVSLLFSGSKISFLNTSASVWHSSWFANTHFVFVLNCLISSKYFNKHVQILILIESWGVNFPIYSQRERITYKIVSSTCLFKNKSMQLFIIFNVFFNTSDCMDKLF